MLSPRTAKLDRSSKLATYAHHGVSHAWLVDPKLHTLEVLRVDPEKHWTTLAVHTDSEIVRALPFEAFALDLALLWADVEAPGA